MLSLNKNSFQFLENEVFNWKVKFVFMAEMLKYYIFATKLKNQNK